MKDPAFRLQHARRARAYRAANATKIADAIARRKYGLSHRELVGLYRIYKWCPGCGTKLTRGRRHIDHDHHTGKLRGVLCRECNLALGHVKDDPEILAALIRYLRYA